MSRIEAQITAKAVLQSVISKQPLDIPSFCKPNYPAALRHFLEKDCSFPDSFDDRLNGLAGKIEELFNDIKNNIID